jgi:predicted branched-subunit amino acid permease
MQITCTSRGMARGAVASLPLLLGTLPFGLVCGIVGQMRGLSGLEITLMSALVYGGSAQIVALGSWAHPAPVLGATMAALAVNLRFALMGPVLGPWLDRMRGWRLFASLYTLADQNWALSVKELQKGGTDAGFVLGSGGAIWLCWVASTAAGYAMATVLHLPAGHPLFFAALAIFVAMLAAMWRGRRDILPWLVAALTAIAVHLLAPGSFWHIVAGALAGSLAGGLRDRA